MALIACGSACPFNVTSSILTDISHISVVVDSVY